MIIHWLSVSECFEAAEVVGETLLGQAGDCCFIWWQLSPLTRRLRNEIRQ